MPQFAVILPAAGLSTRFGGARSKLAEPLGGQTVLERSILAFTQREDIETVLVATRDVSVSLSKVICCGGGTSRAQSVRNALRIVPSHIEWLAVHDAARPLVSQELIARTFTAALQHGAAVPALPVALTIKQARGPLPAKVQRTVPRDQLWAMQTPQVMRRAALLDAFDRCPIPLDQVTDDMQLLELAGHDVWLVPGDERNLKITTPMDIKLAELWLGLQG
ncbi:MAG TPA: 2-C-methyl-D-erythritol 4-phosphate cytidylyltransferase [Tepidisphaeraceae bacterium]|nr:2-C-methyl-D-erythritol 4-phosphate cytidylyltransferase [Tepidisphaeraceae bacterium]